VEPLTWATLIPLIVKVGIPAAEKLWTLATSNAPVTPAEWKMLRDLNETPFDSLVPKVTP
jgi:hypothetical protein